MIWKEDDGTTVGTIMITPETDEEEERIKKDKDILNWYIQATILKDLQTINEGWKHSPQLQKIQKIEFIIPDEIAYYKQNIETIKRIIETDISKNNYPFKVILSTLKEQINL